MWHWCCCAGTRTEGSGGTIPCRMCTGLAADEYQVELGGIANGTHCTGCAAALNGTFILPWVSTLTDLQRNCYCQWQDTLDEPRNCGVQGSQCTWTLLLSFVQAGCPSGPGINLYLLPNCGPSDETILARTQWFLSLTAPFDCLWSDYIDLPLVASVATMCDTTAATARVKAL